MKSKNQLRIIAGEHSGQSIMAPQNTATHPMGERERIAIFNQVREYLPGARVLDAFAGSGALGITALSCGAESVDFLEKNPEAIKAIKSNLEKHKYNTFAKIFRTLDNSKTYNLIFADPPYDNPQQSLVAQIATQLEQNGIFVLSHPQNCELPEELNQLNLLSDRKYAAAQIKIYQKQ